MMLVKSYVTSLLLVAFFVHGAESFVNNRASGNSCIAGTNYENYDLLSQSTTSKLNGSTPSFSRGTKISEMKMVRSRGLEIREESATPLPGGMTLYLKAGPDGTSVGDCPFAHYVRMVLHEKGLEYDVKPCTQDTKPKWLIDYYDGSMPALRHRKECYTESDVIAQYLDFFFQEPSLSSSSGDETASASECLEGFFPSVAKYLKSTSDGDEQDESLRSNLEEALGKIEQHLQQKSTNDDAGPFLVGTGENISLMDCSLAPKLFHLKVGLAAFKNNAIDIPNKFPLLQKYMDTIFSRDSFQQSLYAEEIVVWGWSNARGD